MPTNSAIWRNKCLPWTNSRERLQFGSFKDTNKKQTNKTVQNACNFALSEIQEKMVILQSHPCHEIVQTFTKVIYHNISCVHPIMSPHTEWCPDPLCFSISEPLFHGYETDHAATAINDILILLHLGMWPSVCMLHSHTVWFWSDRNLLFLSIIYPKTCLLSLSHSAYLILW